MHVTLELPETGCTEHNGSSWAIEEVRPAMKVLEVHFEGIGEE